MDWFTGGVGGGANGWEDDDDIGDFSDQSLDDEEDKSSGNEQMPEASHTQTELTQPDSVVQIGGGMFMGRLTRFLEAVTQPSSGEEEEEEDGEGWADDEDLGALDEVDVDVEDETPQALNYSSPSPAPDAPSPAFASATSSRLMASPIESTQPEPLPSQSQLVDSGWDDDLDLNFDPPQPFEETIQTTSGEHPMPLNDVESGQPSTRDVSAEEDKKLGRGVSFGDLPSPTAGDISENEGWDDDDGLDGVMIGDDVLAEETEPAHAPSRLGPSPSNAARTETTVANSTFSPGWDEDDQECEGLEDNNDDYDAKEPSQMVDHTPPPPLPSALATSQSPVTTSSTLQSQSVSFGGASAVAVASPSVVQDCWEDEGEDAMLNDHLGQSEKDDQEIAPRRILDRTPPTPPHRSANDTNSQAVSFAAPSTATVAASMTSGWEEDNGTLDDFDVEDVNIEDPEQPRDDDDDDARQLLDHTSPSPLLPRQHESVSQGVSFAAHSTSAVATSNESGWDDDGTLEDLDVDDYDEYDANGQRNKVVDMTPLPPLPPRNSAGAASASAIAVGTATEDNGWGDDDDLGNLDDEEDGQDDDEDEDDDATPLVDHTPPPPPPPPPRGNTVGRDTTTDVAVVEMEPDDDISQDDTLSIANSRARYEEHQYQLAQPANPGPPVVDQIPLSLRKSAPFKRVETTDAIRSTNSIGSSTLNDFQPTGGMIDAVAEEVAPFQDNNVVDHTPSVCRLDRNSSAEESMMALRGRGGGGAAANSSVSDSWDSLSDRISDVRTRSRRMVDLTPPAARFHRGIAIDTSLAVAGQTSVGESLDSIDEEHEEPESPEPREHAPSPVAVEAGWGGEHRQQPGEELTININDRLSAAIPFGSAVTPTASSSAALSRVTPRAVQDNEDGGDDGVPLVDQTPLPLIRNHSTAASIDVLSVSSEEGDLGESIVGIDDVKEDLYGQVVDHTPATPNPAERPKVNNVGILGAVGTKQEDDTVAGVAENTDVEKDIKADDEMDDESSRGTKTTLEEYENRSLISSVRLTIPEEKQLVDHVPQDRKISRTADTSTMVFADTSSGSSPVDDDIVNDDDTFPAGFGPIVDHTPSVHFRSARSVATSVFTQNSGLDADLKEDEDLDNTVGPGVSTEGGEEIWGGEQNSLPPSGSEEKHLVDHVPKLPSHHVPVDGSMRVMVDNGDDTTQVDTIAEDAATDFGQIVDHTPFTAGSSACPAGTSMATQFAKPEDDVENTIAIGNMSTGNGDGWENEIPDLEDISAGEEGVTEDTEEPTMVDHVPRRSFSRPTDTSTVVVLDPMDAESAVGYEDQTTTNVPDGRYGPVVDQTPTPPMPGTPVSIDESMRVQANKTDVGNRNDDEGDDEDGGTWFGASTVGGVSTDRASGDASTAGDDSSRGGWENDDMLDDLASPTTFVRQAESYETDVVDHVPPITTPRPSDASLAVMIDPSVASSRKEGTEDNIDDKSFGAVVDHTPSLAKASHHSVANSMATNASGIATDIKRDEEMDETTWNGGISTHDEGWDQDEAELEELAEADEDQIPPLVDHVPERPESRPTDASTFVAGDPSEIFSQVDDLGQDEANFGPVVDQTPRGQNNIHTSAAGSTIVNIASVAEDDLDVAVEKAIDGEDPRREAQEQTGWQETLPNPQAGNEEDSQQDSEQLVDYVPAEQEEELPDLVRDGSSEMATVGEKSTMIPADDPKEDEFGPVVDQLPAVEGSRQPESRNANGIDGDHAKRSSSVASSGAQNIDSVAPNFSVASNESKEEDGLEENPSREGSTVDALATVSEVEDGFVAGDGWEDDVDIDAAEQPSPSASTRPYEDRNLSVKWVDGLSGKKSVENSASTGDSAYFDAEMGDSSRLPLNETRYYDPELGDTNAWGSLNLDEIDDGDDTPPSTPRRNFESRQSIDSSSGHAEKPAVAVTNGSDECKLCVNSSTADCPCVKRLLATNAGREGMVGTLKTPEGHSLKVNFDKLLETEMTKRRLVEKEFQALRSTIDSLKSSKDSLTSAGESQMEVLTKVKDSNSTLSNNLETAQTEIEGMRAQNMDLESRNKRLEEQLEVVDQEKRKLEVDCLALKRDMEILQAEITQVSSSATSDLSARENELQSEISNLMSSNKELSHKIARFETECENMRGKNESLYEDLESYRSSMSKLEEEKAAMLAKESSLNVEIKQLKETLQNKRVPKTGSYQSQIAALQSEIATKSGECADLKSQVASFQKKLTVVDAENSKHMRELEQVAKEKTQLIADYDCRIAKIGNEMQKAMAAKDTTIGELKTKLATESRIIQKLKEEKAALEQTTKADKVTHKEALAEKNRQILAVENARKMIVSKVETVEKERQRLVGEITALTQRLEAAEARTEDFLEIRKERDELLDTVGQSNLAVEQLQAQITQYDQKIEDNASHWQREIDTVLQERDRLAAEVSSSKQKLQEVTKSLDDVQDEKESLDHVVAELQNKCNSLQDASQQRNSAEANSSSKLKEELSQLQSQLAFVQGRNQALLVEQSQQASNHSELEDRLNRVLADLGAAHTERSKMEDRLAESEELSQSMKSEMNQVKAEREQLQTKYQDLLLTFSTVKEDAQRSQNEMETKEKALQDISTECESLRKEVAQTRQDHEKSRAGIDSLHSKLAQSERLLTDKDRSLAVLKEEQEASQEGIIELQKDNKVLSDKVEDLENKIYGHKRKQADFERTAEQHTSSFERMKEDLATVSEERDTFQHDKNMLEEENEEMLVQFGLLKEEMDATDKQVAQLNAERAEWEQSAKDAQVQLEETQKRLDALTANLKGESHQALATMEAAKDGLAQEKRDLERITTELSKKNEDLEKKIHMVESEKVDLLSQIDNLSCEVSESVEAGNAKESRLMSTITDLEGKIQEFSNDSHAQERNMGKLQASLDHFEAAAGDAIDLRHRISTLEQSLAENEQLLKQKDDAIEDLQFQLQNSGKVPNQSQELESLRSTVREMEENAERDKANIKELERLSDQSKEELKETTEQLTTAKTLVEELKNDLQTKQHEEELVDVQERLRATEEQLMHTKQDASSFRVESIDLSGRLAAIKSELEDYRSASQQPAKEPSGQSSAELQSLRRQIEQLKQQQITSSSATGAREELLEREVQSLQQQMKQKDGEIKKLQHEVQWLGTDRSEKHNEVQIKQNRIEELSSKLEDLRSKGDKPETSHALELTRNEAEDAEKMRSQIVSLAKALEQSEGRRAMSIERLENERQSNADSLRRLTESVKRFYSTLSLGDN